MSRTRPGSKVEDRQEEDQQVEQALADPDIHQIVEEHTEQLGIPAAGETGKVLTEQQMEKQEEASNAPEQAQESSSEESESDSSGGLKVVPYQGEAGQTSTSPSQTEETAKTDENQENEQQESQEESQEQSQEQKQEENASLPPQPTTPAPQPTPQPTPAPQPSLPKLIRQEGKKHESIHASNFMDAKGENKNLFKSSTLDKVQTGMDIGSGVLSAGSSGAELFTKEGYLGGKLGVDGSRDKDLNNIAGGASLGSDALSLASGGISIYKDIQDRKGRDEFTTESEKTRQNLSLAGNIIGMTGTAVGSGGTIAGLVDNNTTGGNSDAKKASSGLGAVSNLLGGTQNVLDIVKDSSTLNEAKDGRKKLEQAAAGSQSDEFKKHAQLAMEAQDLQKTGAGFNIAKSAAGLFGNLTGMLKKAGDFFGVDEKSTFGKVLKWGSNIGSAVNLAGTGLGLIGTGVKKKKRSNRAHANIDAYIDTPGLQQKINQNGLQFDATKTRGLVKRTLGYRSSEEMFSAILMTHAKTIREKAEQGTDEEKSQYTTLIQTLGFKVAVNGNLPSVDAIAEKLSGAGA